MLEDNSDSCNEVSTRIDRASIFMHQQWRHKPLLLYVSTSINSIIDQHAASHIGSGHVNNTRTTKGSVSKVFN